MNRLNHAKSQEIFARAKQLMPGGVNSPARAFGGVGGEPIVFDRAAGPHLFDVDGNCYLDYIGSWGPMILGHGHPKVLAAVHQAVDKAFSFGAPSPGENELCELITEAVPSMEMVRAGEFRHRSDHERHSPGAGLYESRVDYQIRRQLSWACGCLARRRRKLRRDSRCSEFARRYGWNRERYADLSV